MWVQGTGIHIACINTSYSRADEVEITSDLGHLIIGAFAHHGPGFYQNEVKRCLKLLQGDPQHFEARNDLGAAYTKLEMWEEAQVAFDRNEELHPGKYETAANLGVMYKKMGEYAAAESSMRRSLQLKPGGHMGLGDYYLQMIQWQKDNVRSFEERALIEGAEKFQEPSHLEQLAPDAESKAIEPEWLAKNFLGVPYDAGQKATAEIANKEYVVTLIKNDMTFSDAYIVLGDICFEEGNFQLALRAYFRASGLSISQDVNAHAAIASQRQIDVINTWREKAHPGHVIEDGPDRDRQLDNELAAASMWLEEFQSVEEEFVKKGRDASFAALKPELKRRGIIKPQLFEAVHYQGTATVATPDHFTGVALAVGLFVALLVFAVPVGVAGTIVAYFVVRNRSASSDNKVIKT
jgi:tetratricopeptide (TPR) repeat protein